MATEAQQRARNKWNREHRDKQKIYNYRSHTKTFISDYATSKDIEEIEKLLQQRKQLLNEQTQDK